MRDVHGWRLSAETHVEVPEGGADALVVFRRPWQRGYRAWVDDRSVPVERVSLLMPGVRVPAGTTATVRLAYRPPSLFVGGVLALGALSVCLWAWRKPKR
jgi:uncharacterized membrane protein YfhO